MMNKKASVAKWVALAVVPLSLMAVLSRVAQPRRAEAATREMLKEIVALRHDDGTTWAARWARVQDLISQGADVNARDEDGLSPLHYFGRGLPSAVRFLLDRGADVNARDRSGTTVLMYVLISGDAEVVRLLLSHGADVHATRGSNKQTALDLAQYWMIQSQKADSSQAERYAEAVQLLKAAGAQK